MAKISPKLDNIIAVFIMVSIITPVHNEEGLIADFVSRAISFLRRRKVKGEVIVVENGSTDKTSKILGNLKFKELRVISLPVGNKGLALRQGMEAASGENLITLDTDLWDERFVEESLQKLKNYDVVVGSKSIAGAKDTRPFLSRLFNLGYNFLFRLIFNFQGTETHALLSFRRKEILPLVRKCRTSELVFDTELILRAERTGLSKIEIPVLVKEVRPRRYSLLKQLIKTVQNSLLLGKTLGLSPNWAYVLVLAALVLGTFLRFYNYYQWFFFSVDEEHYSFMTRMITVDRHFPLIGGPISGTRLYMAPWFLYFNAIWFWLSNNSPVFSGAIFAAMELGVVVLIYLLGKRLVGQKAAAVGSLLYSGSFLMALFDRHYWNITLTPLISVATFYFLFRWLEEKQAKWLIVLGLIVGFGLSATFSVFAVFLFAVLAIFIYDRKGLPLFLGIIILMHLPLILFDLRHDFWLWRALFDISPTGGQTQNILGLMAQTLGKALVIDFPLDVSNETSICPLAHYVPPIWTIVLGLVALAGVFFSKRALLVGLLLVVNIVSLLLFRADAGERHFLPLLPVFFILAGGMLTKLPKGVTIVVVVLLLAVNFSSFINSYASAGIAAKEKVVRSIMARTKPREFYLDSLGECHKWGYRYLFSQFNHEPAASFMDPEFSWMYSQKPNPEAVKTYEVVKN